NTIFHTLNKNRNISYSKPTHPKTSFYTLIDTLTGNKISFATDLYDHAEHFSATALNTCDFYFKRSFESDYVQSIEQESKAEILPLGLTFGTHSEYKHTTAKFFLGLFFINLRINLKWDRHILNRLKKTYMAQRRHWNFIN